MSDRLVNTNRIVVDGRPLIVELIHNPIIDDIVISEARIQAYSIDTGVDVSDRSIGRDIRDFLLRLGVER